MWHQFWKDPLDGEVRKLGQFNARTVAEWKAASAETILIDLPNLIVWQDALHNLYFLVKEN